MAIKWAYIIDNKTKEVGIGLGTDINFYKSHGFTEMDVEEAWNGTWYLKGHCPEKPKEEIIAEKISELQKFLDETDWYITRFIDNGTPIPQDIKNQRQSARKEIDKLRDEGLQDA